MISCLLLIESIAKGTQFLEILTSRPQSEVKEETCQTPVTFFESCCGCWGWALTM